MNKKRQKHTRNKMSILPKSKLSAIALLICGFAEATFILFVILLDVLPLKYLLLLLFVIFAIDTIAILLMNSKTRQKTKTMGALVIIVLMLNVLLFGDYYIYNTFDTLQKISEQRGTWEYYHVLALKDGQYQSVGDIEGETVYIADMESKQLNEASERLVTKADVHCEKVAGLIGLGQKLVDDPNATEVSSEEIEKAKESTSSIDEKTKIAVISGESADETATGTTSPTKDNENTASTDVLHDNLILVSNSEYGLIKSNIDGFSKNTKSIYKMKVKKRANDNSKAVDVTKDSFNVLISGIDQWGTIDEGGLTDVNMVMTVNPTTREILLTSIPRDSYIPLHSYGEKDKLTHSGIYGEEETRQTIEDFLDIDINYTMKVNFSLLCDVIDAIGGIRVYNDIDFMSHPKGWHYKKGWLDLNEGHYALWFARERKSFTDGDMKRNENQQKVLTAMLKKVTSSKVILTRYTSILNAVEDEMQTNLTDRDLKKLVKMQLNDMKKWNIERINITGATGGAPCFSMGGQNLSCVFPSEETVDEAKKAIHDTMYPAEINGKDNDGSKTDQ